MPQLSALGCERALKRTRPIAFPTWGAYFLSFVQAEDDLDGVHDRRVAVLVAILGNPLLVLCDCFGFDDRAVAFAVVVPAKPQHHVPLRPRELPHHNLLARYFYNVDCHLSVHRRDLHKQE
jgi:hypothetical protein